MAENRRFERFGIALAVLMSAAALGLEIHQRQAPAPVSPTETPANAIPPAPPRATSPEGDLMPLPVGKDDKEILGKGKDLIRMQGIVHGKKLYELTARRLILTRDESTTTAEGIQGTMISGGDAKPAVRFTAERVIMNMQTKDLRIQGRVHVESVDPKNKISFDTRDMNWTAQTETLVCPNPVEVTQPGILLRGNSMRADVRLKTLSLDGGIYLEAEASAAEKTLGIGGSGNSAGGGKGGR